MNGCLPCCGFKPNIHTEIKIGSRHIKARKGDIAICNNCGSWFIYLDDAGACRAFKPRDEASIPPTTLLRMRRLTRAIRKRGRL